MLWKCTVCGYLHAGDTAPEACPKCGVPADKFAALSEEDAQKVITSERTNDIHMQISNLASKIEVLAQEGIDLNLDPPCLTQFKQAKAEARVIKQRSKAEIAGHVGKGKW